MARRWVVEAAHGWFNKFRKLLVRCGKLERSYLALCHLAAAIIVFRKVRSETNIIYE
jgi:transposase